MRKYLLIICCLLSSFAWAGDNVFKMIAKMEKLQVNKQYIEAMDTAVRVLVVDSGNRIATNFVHDHWDNMVKFANTTMENNADELSLEQSLVRLETCRVLADIADNMRGVQMPLYGPNQSWVWYPELYYSQGDYDNERIHVYNLLTGKAEAALRSYDADGARKYFLQAISYLYPGKERKGNIAAICKQLLAKMKQLSSTPRIPDAIFAYEMSSLSLSLDTTQDTVRTLQPALQQHVSDLYLSRSKELKEEGDSVKAKDYYDYALDWCTTDCPK